MISMICIVRSICIIYILYAKRMVACELRSGVGGKGGNPSFNGKGLHAIGNWGKSLLGVETDCKTSD